MQLLVLTCYINLRGQFIARELVYGQTMENLDLIDIVTAQTDRTRSPPAARLVDD